MLMGYVEVRKQNQQEDDESKPKGRWVSCPDMPDGLLTVDDETPYKILKEMNEESEYGR